jgi:hypothetical protein
MRVAFCNILLSDKRLNVQPDWNRNRNESMFLQLSLLTSRKFKTIYYRLFQNKKPWEVIYVTYCTLWSYALMLPTHTAVLRV